MSLRPRRPAATGRMVPLPPLPVVGRPTTPLPDVDTYEEGYSEGHKRAHLSVLGNLLRDTYQIKDPLVALAQLVKERGEAIATLRSLCREHGITSKWDDDLYLPDIIEKHLERGLTRYRGTK